MKTESEFRESLRSWILKKNGKIQADDLRDDTPIIEQRIITSLQLMDLILELEKMTGNPVEVEELKPGVFKNIDSICKNFLEAK